MGASFAGRRLSLKLSGCSVKHGSLRAGDHRGPATCSPQGKALERDRDGSIPSAGLSRRAGHPAVLPHTELKLVCIEDPASPHALIADDNSSVRVLPVGNEWPLNEVRQVLKDIRSTSALNSPDFRSKRDERIFFRKRIGPEHGSTLRHITAEDLAAILRNYHTTSGFRH
jgi:hypothetical protein